MITVFRIEGRDGLHSFVSQYKLSYQVINLSVLIAGKHVSIFSTFLKISFYVGRIGRIYSGSPPKSNNNLFCMLCTGVIFVKCSFFSFVIIVPGTNNRKQGIGMESDLL